MPDLDPPAKPASSAPNPPAEHTRTARPLPDVRSRGWRMAMAVPRLLARVGIGPFHLLTTRGRKTGRLFTIPTNPVRHDGRRWLVAPLGAVGWVHNARAA